MQKPGHKLPSTGVVFAAVLAVTAGACGTPPPSESAKPAPAADALSTLASEVASGFFSTTDSVMADLGFGPPDDVSEGAADGTGNADDAATKKTSVTPTGVVTPTSPPRSRAPVAPAEVDPRPVLETGSSVMAIEAPAAIAQTPYDLPREVDDSTVYTVADLDVLPPIMHSIDPPRWRPWDGQDADVVEVVVSQKGGVDRIRFVSQPRQMVDMMALSAAKMWKFEPALKDGQPVRYRLFLHSPRTASYR